MANILDYLEWRGDLTFAQAPFNEVDNLLLTQLPYVDLGGIVPAVDNMEEAVSIWEASEHFFSIHTEDELLERVTMTRFAPFVMQKMAQTRRFHDVRLFRYVNDISQEEESQFCAVCAALPDGTVFVAYSGTDSTIIGWKEDFNMTFLSETPGQMKAVIYLNFFADHPVPLRIGGHSKGGNLAVYASIRCENSIKDRIIAIYNDDGPGFASEVADSEDYQQMVGRIQRIVPESSIVGMLLEHAETEKVVRSTMSGRRQHDGLTWEVMGDHFVTTDGVSQESQFLEKTLGNWMEHMEAEEKAKFVDTLFGILERANIETTEELGRLRWKNIMDLIKVCTNLSKESQNMVVQVMQMLWTEANHTIRARKLEKKAAKKELKQKEQQEKKQENQKKGKMLENKQ